MDPKNDEAGDVELTSKTEIATGRLVSAEGKVKIASGATFTFTLVREKPVK